jgi:transcriptional regulator
MYIPEPFAVHDPAEIDRLLSEHPFATLVTHDAEGLLATHMPFLYDAERQVLAGHMARANPHRSRSGGGEALAVFQGVNAYVSPNWYPTKAESGGRAVPTWDYEAVHVYGRVQWQEDQDWVRTHLSALAERFERGMPEPWMLSDAPQDYVQRLFRGLVGLELTIERVEAKRKLSQNRPQADRLGVIAGLSASASPFDNAVAEVMRDLPNSP